MSQRQAFVTIHWQKTHIPCWFNY